MYIGPWALLTSHIILVVGLDRELCHPRVSDCMSPTLSAQVSWLESRCKTCRRSMRRPLDIANF